MRRALVSLLAGAWAVAGWTTAHGYGFPIEDPFLATVVGTPPAYRAELPKQLPLRERNLTVFEDRAVPEFLWYASKLRYAYALQRNTAPLIFLIAGTGAGYNGSKNVNMARAFYGAGFHVVLLSSPTHMNFIVAASKTGVPGHAFDDAEDLYRVMERVWDRLKSRIEVSAFYVSGYSLGGFNAAFVSSLDEHRRTFRFEKALLINPPVRLYSSISLLDRMLQNIPGGVDNFTVFYNRLVEEVGRVYQRSDSVDIGGEFLYRAIEAVNPNDEELAALIGTAFRISAANMAFTSDLMTDFGYIKPENLVFHRNTSPRIYGVVAHRLGFTDFYHAYFYPYFRERDPSLTREQLIEKMSLTTIEDYLGSSTKIEVMHNQDDIILEPGEIEFFPRIFGERAKIYPRGGHCGNMEYVDNVAHMLGVFEQ